MSEITVHQTYCPEHGRRHFLTFEGVCFGSSNDIPGYRYSHHVGGGWYRYYSFYQTPMDEMLEALVEEHDRQAFSASDIDF